jgi:DNA primase small subunit
LEKEICTRNPFKIDIGPVLSIRPKNHRSNPNIKPLQRELVFDIDLTDYDEVRTCCSADNICRKCWKFMSISCEVLDKALRDDFGFEHILWVFSGRRGIHCWVCDKSARHLDTKGRSAIADYLQISSVSGTGESSITKVSLYDNQHHSIKRARAITEKRFQEIILEDQNLFSTTEGIKKLLLMISDENYRREVQKELTSNDSKQVWKSFCSFFESLRRGGQLKKKFHNIIEEVQLAMLYPRLDINVSKGTNHLLKSPFCIHPKTGKVCVPFRASKAESFDPITVPTINILLDEINAHDKKNKENVCEGDEVSRIKDYKKTQMSKSVEIFEEFLRKLEQSLKQQAIQVSDKKMDF